ncbi:hypothetical protein EXIGLDRAFT_840246 [Exidia glandulosa HHB12029]|uniref:Chitinase n=1 Tax=Exidia glandulosa HHB12029 TaxID=1314781 RepID=A0A165EK92_EXIGL|nr:hypothetical protein EXIGLDRAFT_840246 [Exidia glandulosa HHB12029]
MAPQKSHPLFGRLWMSPSDDESYTPMSEVPDDWDFIILNAALNASASTFTFASTGACFQPQCSNHETEDGFIAAVKQKVATGSSVNLAIDTSSSASMFATKTGADLDELVSRAIDVVNKYGFNGAVLDCGPCEGAADDAATIARYCGNVAALLGKFSTALGTDFVLSVEHYVHQITSDIVNATCTCPEIFTSDVQDNIAFDVITWMGWNESFINFTDVDGRTQQWYTVDGLVAVSDLFLRGLSESIASIKPHQLVINNGNGHRDDYIQLEQRTMSCITEGVDCDAYGTLKGGPSPAFAGVPYLDFSINQDAAQSNAYGTAMRTFLDALLVGNGTPSAPLQTSEAAFTGSTASSSPTGPNPNGNTVTDSSLAAHTPVIVAAAIGTCLAVLAVCLSVRYFLLRHSRRNTIQGGTVTELGPYNRVHTLTLGTASETRPQPTYLPSKLRGNATSPSYANTAPYYSTDVSTRLGRTPGSATEEDDSPEQIAALRAAVRRAGFSVSALLQSLGRVHSSVPPPVASPSVQYSMSDTSSIMMEFPPKYGEASR